LAPGACHHVDVPAPGSGLCREAVEKRGIAVLEEPSIQRKPTELAELAILDRDIFADTPPEATLGGR